MTMSYPIVQRRAVEEALLERHRKALLADDRLTEDAWPDPFTDYRRAVLRRAARIVEISGQTDFSSMPFLFQRCATAAVDHAGLDLVV